MKKKTKAAKFDAVQIKNGALEQEGQFIAAQIKAMRGYEAAAEEKAGVELKKAQNNRTTVEKRLADVYAKCKADGIKAFRAMYAPDFGRTKLYQILAIGSGKTTREEIRTKERDKKREQRAAANPGQANVPDTSPEPQPEAAVSDPPAAVVIPLVTEPKAGNDTDPDASAAQRKAENAAAANAEGHSPDTPAKKSKRVLATAKSTLDEILPDLTMEDKAALFHYFKFHREMVGVKRAAA
jgi:hypothetical protein